MAAGSIIAAMANRQNIDEMSGFGKAMRFTSITFVCGGLALILQNGAYISEILRGSVNAIDRVQFDAAKSLGLASWSTFRKVVLPQVLVYSIPALGNQVVLLLKDTSLLSAISITELTMQAKLLTEQTGAAYEAFIVVALLYLLLVSSTEVLFRVAHHAVRWR